MITRTIGVGNFRSSSRKWLDDLDLSSPFTFSYPDSPDMLDLKISLGESIDTLKPWTAQPFIIDGSYFKGAIDVRIKGLSSHHYFEKTNDLFCIHVHGRFLGESNADDDGTTVDDIIFGNQFELPLNLPTGFFMLTKFAQWWDPGLDMHLEDQQPYAFSPLVVTLNTLSISTDDAICATCEPSVEISEPFEDNTTLWFPGSTKPLSSKQRQHYFNNVENRQKVKVRPDQIWMGDFKNGYMDMMNGTIQIPGFSIDALKYYQGQPLRYICKKRDDSIIYFVIEFDLSN